MMLKHLSGASENDEEPDEKIEPSRKIGKNVTEIFHGATKNMLSMPTALLQKIENGWNYIEQSSAKYDIRNQH